MKVAIIGAGISGLTAAYYLRNNHEVEVLESAERIGGHTATVNVCVDGIDYAIDTGFIVYNDWTYPNFIKLLNELGVKSQPTEMSFSVSCDKSGLEYGGNNLNTLLAQRRNIFRPKFWRMVRDILRFNREAVEDLTEGRIDSEATLGQYLQDKGYSRGFIDDYLVPMGCAIWSSSTESMLNFPLLFFVRFFKNHGLLSVNHRPQWRVIAGGSSAYLAPLVNAIGSDIKTGVSIESVKRHANGVTVLFCNGESCEYDQVVFACHSDQALALLAEPSALESQILSAMPYQSNDVVLHTDETLLPKKKLAWSSWNYQLREKNQGRPILTYAMNILQGLESETNFCVTLNDTASIDPSKILGRYQYAHPVFSKESVAASERWSEINNSLSRTWFCGAYWANGFHEDGVVSGKRVADILNKLGAGE